MKPQRIQDITRLFASKAYLADGIYSMEGGIIWECLGEIKELTVENARLRQYLEDTSDGFECLPLCDSNGHEAMCPVTNVVAAWRQLRSENARLREALQRIAGNYPAATRLAEADEPLSALIAHEALKDKP